MMCLINAAIVDVEPRYGTCPEHLRRRMTGVLRQQLPGTCRPRVALRPNDGLVMRRSDFLKLSGTTRIWLPAAVVNATPFHNTLANEFKAESGILRTRGCERIENCVLRLFQVGQPKY
jgi:hypothetical protein